MAWAGLVVKEGQERGRAAWRVRENGKGKLCLGENTGEGGEADGSGEREESGSKRQGRRASGLGQSWPWCEVCVQEPSGEEGCGVSLSPSSHPTSTAVLTAVVCRSPHSPGACLPPHCPVRMRLLLGLDSPGSP